MICIAYKTDPRRERPFSGSVAIGLRRPTALEEKVGCRSVERVAAFECSEALKVFESFESLQSCVMTNWHQPNVDF